jgi:hypothetical protein
MFLYMLSCEGLYLIYAASNINGIDSAEPKSMEPASETVSSEYHWSNHSPALGLEEKKGERDCHSGQYQSYIRWKAEEDIPMSSIEEDEPRRFPFILPRLNNFRLFARILAILMTVIAGILILVAIGSFNKAKKYGLSLSYILKHC